MGESSAESGREACTRNQGEACQAITPRECAVPDGGQYADRAGAGESEEEDGGGQGEESGGEEDCTTTRGFQFIMMIFPSSHTGRHAALHLSYIYVQMLN